MTGALLSLTAGVCGLVAFLLSVPGIQGLEIWGVTYRSTQICAVKGSTVEIRCSFWFPPTISYKKTTVEKTLWFTKMDGDGPVELTSDPQYSGRVSQSCEDQSCTLTLRDVTESDSAHFHFRFITNQEGGRYTGKPGVTLTVTDPELQVQLVEKSSHSSWGKLMCRSSCLLPHPLSYIWYKNGERVPSQTSSHYSDYLYSTDSFSCAVEGHENFPSPSVCAVGESCSRVTYTDRSICAPEGSSVDISCSYNSYHGLTSKLWFSPGRGLQWQSPSQSSTDSQYGGRVQVLDTWSGLLKSGRSTLRISDLTQSDSVQYRFRFTAGSFEWGSSLPGTTLTVTALQVQVTRVTVRQSYIKVELKCQSSCRPAGPLSYIWSKNGERIYAQTSSSYEAWFSPGDSVSCALKGHENFPSPSVYGPKPPSVSVSPSGEIVEGSSVTLTCSSDATPAANYTWYKENGTLNPVRTGPQLVFSSILSSDSGQYYCRAENKLGRRTSEHTSIHVRYAPKPPSVSVSPSGEIVEGSSVTLTCSSDANPAAKYTWYKENQQVLQGPTIIYESISSEDRGVYHCQADNQYGRVNSSSLLIDVQYAPKPPSVSVSSSGEIVEGSSVTLTCSSDANPAANYTWYKENEDSPKASGQNFTITDFRAEHSGNYYCEAQNERGHQNSTSHNLTVVESMKSAVFGSVTAVFLAVIFLSAFLLIRRKKSKETTGKADMKEQPFLQSGQAITLSFLTLQTKLKWRDNDLLYASIHMSQSQDYALYSNIRAARPRRQRQEEEHEVLYAAVQFKTKSPESQKSDREDPAAVYSTINKTR
ncbi:uncharacterized protein V6R79_019410 [Siganus canaliculatus]